MATVPKRVASRITSELRRYQKILEAAHARDVNESNTVVIITDFLSDVLGFDKYSEITAEYAIRGTYCDLAIKVGGTVQYLIEAKAIGLSLKERHLRQAIGYAVTHGVEWVLLTNGVTWHVYRMAFEQPVSHSLVFSLNLLEAASRDPETIEKLYLISREGLSKSAIEEYSEHKDALNPVLVGAVLLTDPVVSVLRRELRRITPGAKADDQEIRETLTEEVLKREIVEGEEARSASGKVKRAASRSLRKRPRVTKEEAEALVASPRSETPLANK